MIYPQRDGQAGVVDDDGFGRRVMGDRRQVASDGSGDRYDAGGCMVRATE